MAFKNYGSSIRNISSDDILHALGLERERSSAVFVAPALAAFGVGILVGAGMAVYLAPQARRELQTKLDRGIEQTAERARGIKEQVTH